MYRALDLRVVKQELNGTQIPCPPVDKRGLGATEGVRSKQDAGSVGG